MTATQHFKMLENMYLGANVNHHAFPGTRISVGKDTAEIIFEVTPDYHHALGAMHGAVYFKMLDDACFFAAQSTETEVYVLTSSFTLYFTRPFTTGVIHAVGKLKHRTKNSLIAQADLYSASGKLLASGSGTFAKSKVALSAEVGYKL